MENENFKLECPESLISISQKIFKDLEKKKENIFDFFEITNFEKVNIKLFDNVEDYRNYLKDPNIPEYSAGGFIGKSIYTVINPMCDNNIDIQRRKIKEERRISSVAHEFVHIIYNNIIVEERQQQRITWFDEGLAQCLSGEKDFLEYKDNFKIYFINVIKSTNEIPDLNSLVHRVVIPKDKPFRKSDFYDGYALSFIAVKYMFEVLGKQKVRELMKDEEKLLEVGNTVIKDAFEYFKEKYCIQSKKDIDEEFSL